MSKRKQLMSTLLLLMLGAACAFGQENLKPLTLEEAMQIVEAQNPALQQAKLQIKQKEYEQKAKRGLYFPKVSLNANAISMSDPLHLDLNPIKDAIAPLYGTLGKYGVFSGVPNPDPNTNGILPVLPDEMSTSAVREKLLEGGNDIANGNWDRMIQEKNFASVSAGLVWPLFTGGKIKGANQAADVGVQISREELREKEGVLLTELVSRYYGLSLGMQVLQVRQQMLKAVNNHYFDAQKLFDNGMIAKVELLHAKVSRNEARREMKEAERNIDIIRAGLEATLAFDSAVYVLPTSQLFMNSGLPEIAFWVKKAQMENPGLRQIEGKKELINIKNKVEKGSYLPTVAMMGNYNLANKNLSPYMPDWLVGVGLQWTVFDGMARSNKIKAGETLQNQVDFAEQKAHADLKAYLTKLYNELQMQMEQKTELETTLELAEEYAGSTEKAFVQGLATSTSVVDAHSKVAQVKAMRLKVLFDYDVTLAQLLQTAGMPEQYVNFCTTKTREHAPLQNIKHHE